MKEYIGYFCSKDDKTIITVNFDSSENLLNKNKILSRTLDYTIILIEDFDGNELPLDEFTKNKYYDANNQITIYLDKNNLYMDYLYEVRPDLYKKHCGSIRKYYYNGILRSEYFLSNGLLEGDFILYNSEREIIAKINYVNGNIHGNAYAVVYDWFVKHCQIKYIFNCTYNMNNLIDYELILEKEDVDSIIYELIDITYQIVYDEMTNTYKYSYTDSKYNIKWIMKNDLIETYDIKLDKNYVSDLIKNIILTNI
jgi:hypothetical protein